MPALGTANLLDLAQVQRSSQLAATDRSWADPQFEQSDQQQSARITTSDRVTTEQDQDKGEEDDREGDGMDDFADW